METPQIPAAIMDGTLVVSDEFTWGAVGRTPLRWRILELGAEALTAITVATLPEEAAADFAATPFFVPSAAQVEAWFPREAARVAEGNNHNWWLADEGGAPGFAACVDNGWINTYGAQACSGYAAPRPAVTLPLADVELLLSTDEVDADSGEPVFACENGAALAAAHPVVLASEAGEELLLEALEAEDVFLLESFVQRFGVQESWETMLVETLTQLAAAGDSAAVNRLLDMCGGVEAPGEALAEAMAAGHISVAASLLRAGARLDGSARPVSLSGDTPELRRQRKEGYPGEAELAGRVVTADEGFYSIATLVRQGLIKGADYHALLRAAGRAEGGEDLFEWLCCPDSKPLNRMGVLLVKKRVTVVDRLQPHCVPVSQWALQMMWYPKMIQDNPESVRAMCVHLTDPAMEGRRDLICHLAANGCRRELETILAGKKVYSPKDIAAAIDAATQAGKTGIAAYLTEFLRTIGAGKLVADK